MQTYPVDIDPKQVVRWVMAECQSAPSIFRVVARRNAEPREIPLRRELHLGDEEREDLSEIATVATLEVAPAHAADGWLLTIVVEDEIGPRVPEGGAAVEGEQAIDIGSFYSQFIRPERGMASVIAEVEDPAAQARITRLLKAIEKNRHGPGRASEAR